MCCILFRSCVVSWVCSTVDTKRLHILVVVVVQSGWTMWPVMEGSHVSLNVAIEDGEERIAATGKMLGSYATGVCKSAFPSQKYIHTFEKSICSTIEPQ